MLGGNKFELDARFQHKLTVVHKANNNEVSEGAQWILSQVTIQFFRYDQTVCLVWFERCATVFEHLVDTPKVRLDHQLYDAVEPRLIFLILLELAEQV